jgi:hypothetical protein
MSRGHPSAVGGPSAPGAPVDVVAVEHDARRRRRLRERRHARGLAKERLPRARSKPFRSQPRSELMREFLACGDAVRGLRWLWFFVWCSPAVGRMVFHGPTEHSTEGPTERWRTPSTERSTARPIPRSRSYTRSPSSRSSSGEITKLTELGTATDPVAVGEITVGPDGNLWFPDSTYRHVGKLTTAGAVTAFPLPADSADAENIAVGPDGNLWFCGRGAPGIGRVTPAGVITTFPGDAEQSPYDIASGPDGNIWFTPGWACGDRAGGSWSESARTVWLGTRGTTWSDRATSRAGTSPGAS